LKFRKVVSGSVFASILGSERRSLMPTGSELTKEQLYRQAQRLGIKGRSKMTKGQLKAAVSRHRTI
jgi:hypothetical protein